MSDLCRVGALLVVLASAGGCGGVTPPNPPPPPPAGSIVIVPSTGNASVQQGSTAAITVLVSRAGGATGPVTVSVEGLPAGVTAPLSNETTAGAGTTATFDLTITAAPLPTYDLTVTGSPVSVAQGGNGQVALTIARSGGFVGSVALTVEGAPGGLNASFNPAATTGTAATLTVIASAGLASVT